MSFWAKVEIGPTYCLVVFKTVVKKKLVMAYRFYRNKYYSIYKTIGHNKYTHNVGLG